MSFTFTDCKNGVTASGGSCSDLLCFSGGYFDTGHTWNSSNCDFSWFARAYSSSTDGFCVTIYVFGRKGDGYSSQNDFTLTFYCWGLTSSPVKVNRVLNPKSGKVRYMTSHTFKNLTTSPTAASSKIGVKIVGASGTTSASETWTGTVHTINLSVGSPTISISGKTATSCSLTLGGLTRERGFSNYYSAMYRKAGEADWTRFARSNIASDSTATSLAATKSSLTPCTQYQFRYGIGIRNYRPDTEESTYIILFANHYSPVLTAYTNANVCTAPTVTNRTYNGTSQTGVSGGTGVTLDGTRTATAAGTYTATATPTETYNWSATGVAQSSKATKSYTWKISPKPISGSDISITPAAASYPFTGSAIQPTVTVRDATRGVNLTSADYSVGYTANTNVGTATVTITGKGNYTGSKSTTFQITARDVSSGDITATLTDSTFTYTGTQCKPTVTVRDTKRGVTLGTADYSVSYSNNVNAGAATVTITGRGNYTGRKDVGFTILPAASDLSVAATALTLRRGKSASVTYTKTGDGVVTAESSVPTTATAGIVKSSVAVTGMRKGSCTITVRCAATGNYAGSEQCISVEVTGGAVVRYGEKELGTIFFGDRPITAIFYGDKEIT